MGLFLCFLNTIKNTFLHYEVLKKQLQFSSDLLRSLPSSIQGKRGGASIIRPRSISLGAMCEGQEPSKSLPGQKQMVSRLFGTLEKKRNISVQSASGLPGDSRDVRRGRRQSSGNLGSAQLRLLRQNRARFTAQDSAHQRGSLTV